MRVYLNGPVDEVRGVAEMTAATAKEIRALGHTVCVGRELWLGNLPTTKRYRMAVQLLMRCDAIHNMVGYELSWPAIQMQRVALLAGMDQLAVDSGQLAVGSEENSPICVKDAGKYGAE